MKSESYREMNLKLRLEIKAREASSPQNEAILQRLDQIIQLLHSILLRI